MRDRVYKSSRKTRRFFHNPRISLKSQREKAAKKQAETQTRNHAQDPLES